MTLNTAGLSLRNRRILALGVRGGADDKPTDLEVLLARVEGIADLTDEDVAGYQAELEELLRELLDDPRAANDQTLAHAKQVATVLNDVKADLVARASAAAERAAEAERILAEAFGEAEKDDDTDTEDEVEVEAPAAEDDADGTGDHADEETDAQSENDAEEESAPTEDEAEPEKIAASRPRPTTRVTKVQARGAVRAKPRQTVPSSDMILRASGNISGIQPGKTFRWDDDDALFNVWDKAIRASQGYVGPRVEIPVLTAGSENPADEFGEGRTLTWDSRSNRVKIDAVKGRAALRASGGICAPQSPRYEIPWYGTDARPFRDGALTSFGASRGGIRTFPPVTMTDVQGNGTTNVAVSEWTHANDLSPSAPATKPCLTMTCPAESETLVNAYPLCITIGNFRQQFFPEQIRSWMSEIGVWQARYMERLWINAIANSSHTTSIVAQTVLGTARDVLTTLDRLVIQMKQRWRLADGENLRIVLPRWMRDQIRADLTREAPGSSDERLATADAKINSFFAVRSVNVTWIIEGETGQEMSGTQAAGALNGWPSTVIMYAWPEGTWLHLNGGSLDFGLVRDSTLNSVNNFQIMSETFENVHFDGIESLRVTMDVCPNGRASLPVSIDPCAGGS